MQHVEVWWRKSQGRNINLYIVLVDFTYGQNLRDPSQFGVVVQRINTGSAQLFSFLTLDPSLLIFDYRRPTSSLLTQLQIRRWKPDYILSSNQIKLTSPVHFGFFLKGFDSMFFFAVLQRSIVDAVILHFGNPDGLAGTTCLVRAADVEPVGSARLVWCASGTLTEGQLTDFFLWREVNVARSVDFGRGAMRAWSLKNQAEAGIWWYDGLCPHNTVWKV